MAGDDLQTPFHYVAALLNNEEAAPMHSVYATPEKEEADRTSLLCKRGNLDRRRPSICQERGVTQYQAFMKVVILERKQK